MSQLENWWPATANITQAKARQEKLSAGQYLLLLFRRLAQIVSRTHELSCRDFSILVDALLRHIWQMILREQVVNRLAQEILFGAVLIYG